MNCPVAKVECRYLKCQPARAKGPVTCARLFLNDGKAPFKRANRREPSPAPKRRKQK